MERINADVSIFQPSVQTVCVHHLEFGSYISLHEKEIFAIIMGMATSCHCSRLLVVKYSSLSQLTHKVVNNGNVGIKSLDNS